MASHENLNSNNDGDSNDSLNLWRTELSEAQGEPVSTDATELLMSLQDDKEDKPKDAVELLRDALDENEAAGSRESDLANLEQAERRFTRLRKLGDKLLGFFVRREINNKAERREARREMAGKIGSAALETAKKTATFAIETATKAAVEAAMGR